MLWLISIIPATYKVEMEGSWFKASPSQKKKKKDKNEKKTVS
jgi:hypothetical protein